MNERMKQYLLYFSLGLNVALLAGILITGTPDMTILPGEHDEHEEAEFEEWREFESRMTKLQRETQPIRRQIASQQKALLTALKNPATDTGTIQSIHDRIHDSQRQLQNRTLEILLEQRRTLSPAARRRVFNRLLQRHRERYEDLISPHDDKDENEDD